MSKYTTQLRWIVEQEQGQVPYNKYERYTVQTYKKVGLNEYPIFDEAYRQMLNDKIIDHFFFREIGFETAAQFQWYMRRTMNEIMPYYNEMYITQAMIDDPLTDYDGSYLEKGSNESESHNRDVYQDTPMSLLSNTGSPNVEDLDYATNVTYDDASAKSKWDKSHNELGRRHSQSYLMKEYREVYKNIDMEVIDELETLFMGLW